MPRRLFSRDFWPRYFQLCNVIHIARCILPFKKGTGNDSGNFEIDVAKNPRLNLSANPRFKHHGLMLEAIYYPCAPSALVPGRLGAGSLPQDQQRIWRGQAKGRLRRRAHPKTSSLRNLVSPPRPLDSSGHGYGLSTILFKRNTLVFWEWSM